MEGERGEVKRGGEEEKGGEKNPLYYKFLATPLVTVVVVD